jgi:hypothetical protein
MNSFCGGGDFLKENYNFLVTGEKLKEQIQKK